MKKSRMLLLLILYSVVLVLTVFCQYTSIQNPDSRLIVNGLTLLLAAVSFFLFGIIYRGDSNGSQERKGEEAEESKGVRTAEDKATNENKAKDTILEKSVYLEYTRQHEFTRREAEIGLLILSGYSNLQIAEMLYISEATVKKHVSHIYEKSGAAGRKDFKATIKQLTNET